MFESVPDKKEHQTWADYLKPEILALMKEHSIKVGHIANDIFRCFVYPDNTNNYIMGFDDGSALIVSVVESNEVELKDGLDV